MDIASLTPIQYAVVKIDRIKEDEVKIGSQTIQIMHAHNSNHNGVRNGILVKKPPTTWIKGYPAKCDIDAEIGDRVWWEPFFTGQQLNDAKMEAVFEVEGEAYMFIPPPIFTAFMQGDKLMPLNGHVIVEKLPNDEIKSDIIFIPEHIKSNNKQVTRAKVLAAPISLPEYRDDQLRNTEVKEGDVVLVPDFAFSPLDNSYGKSSDAFKTYSRYILAVE